MATLSLSGTLKRSSEQYISSIATDTGSGSTVDVQATLNVNYNSASKSYTFGTTTLKIRGQPSGSTCKVFTSYSADLSNNWTTFGFTPSKKAGSTFTLSWSSMSTLCTYSSSTVSVSSLKVDDYKDVEAKTTIGITVPTASGKTENHYIYIEYWFRLFGGKEYVYYPVTYRNGSTTVETFQKEENTSITIRSGVDSTQAPPADSTASHPYYVYFRPGDGASSVSPNPKELTGRDAVHYEWKFNGWKNGSTIYWPGNSFTVKSTTTFIAQFEKRETGREPSTYPILGSLPYTSKVGFQKTNLWADGNGTPVDSGTQVMENMTLYAQWTPKVYKVQYNTSGVNFDKDNHKPLNFDKTFNDSVILENNTKPYRVGYKFDGWYFDDGKGHTKLYQPGNTFDDTCYKWIATADSNPTVTLVPKWSLVPNTIVYHYYLETGSELTDTGTYTIETSSYSKGAPSRLRGADYAFLGWLPEDKTPADWQIRRGLYTMADEAPDCELPQVVNNIQSIKDWGTTVHYYGFWTITGKYIKVGTSYRKVSMAYVKTQEAHETYATWKRILGVWERAKNTSSSSSSNSDWGIEVGRQRD